MASAGEGLGRRVVAVEANAELVAAGRQRFAAELATGRFSLVHAALVGWPQRQEQAELLFYPHPERSEWGSVDLRWVQRNAQVHGLPHGEPVRVPTLSLEELVERHGCPGFLKCDIEDADEAVLADLGRLAVQQAYLECAPPALRPNGSHWSFEPGCSGPLPGWVDSQAQLL